MDNTLEELPKALEKPLIRSISCFFLLMFSAYTLSIPLAFFWKQYNGVLHGLMELTCIVIAAASFILVWFRFDSNSLENQILALGFLAVAIFNLPHTFYFMTFPSYHKDYLELFLRFWTAGRLTEALVLLGVSTNIKQFRLNKWVGLGVFLTYSLGISYLIFCHPGLFPTLYAGSEATKVKIILEYGILLVILAALWNIRGKLNQTKPFTFKYIIIALLLFIPAELCFFSYRLFPGPVSIYGHLLKVFYYYFLCKGIIETEINAPYIKLEQTSRRLSEILDAVPVAINTYNEDARIDFVNREFEELLCCKKEDFLGLSGEEVIQVIRKMDYQEEGPLVKRVMSGEDNTENIIRTYMNLKGEKLKLLVNARKITNGTLVLFRDVKKEQEIADLNLQTQTILQAMLYPAMILDLKGSVMACNTAFEKLIEMDSSKIVGRNVCEVNKAINFSRNDLAEQLIKDIFVESEYQASFVTKQGNYKEITGHVSTIYNIEREAIGTISVMQDVTDAKENQQKLINQEKLALLGQLGAEIVHETRNYLTTIKGCAQIIAAYSDSGKIKDHAKKIDRNIDEVNRIVSDFLTLSKPRQFAMEEVAISDLLCSIKGMVETSSLLKGIDVNFTMKHEETCILCDEALIRQVILNMCKNAVEAMSETQNPVLTIEAGGMEAANEVFIRISDNGKGMPENHLQKIGTVFFTTKQSGTGLGLHTCYQIIHEHKGRIEVESKVGEGTAFTVFLPCIEFEDAGEYA